MNDVLVALAASSPFLAFLLWAAWWFITDTIRERRQARIAAHMATRYRDQPQPDQDDARNHNQDRRGQAPAA